MEKRLKNKGKRGPAALSVLIAAMFAVTLFAALPADDSDSHESTSLGAGELTDFNKGLCDTIAVGEYHTLVLKDDGSVWAFGYNGNGELGDGTTTDRFTPVQVLGENGEGHLNDVIAVSAGGNHSLVLKSDGTVWGWGHNEYSQLGDGTLTNRKTPVQVVGENGEGHLKDVVKIISGGYHNLVIKSDGTVWGWGSNKQGQLGDGTNMNKNTPVQVLDKGGDGYLKDLISISAGEFFSIALKNDGTVWSWGNNQYCQLGNGVKPIMMRDTQEITRNTPGQVVDETGEGYLKDVTAISAGSRHSLAIKNDGIVWAWGQSGHGKKGSGIIWNDALPAQVIGKGGPLKDVTAVIAGAEQSFAVKNDGTVLAWGSGHVGQLGDGTDVLMRSNPAQVLGEGGIGYLEDVAMVFPGVLHIFALKNDGTIWAWGANNYGQLADTTSELWTNTPLHIHTFKTSWSYDGTEHWHGCGCGARTDVQEHEFIDLGNGKSECICGAVTEILGGGGDPAGDNGNGSSNGNGPGNGDSNGSKGDGSGVKGAPSKMMLLLIAVIIAAIALAYIVAKRE